MPAEPWRWKEREDLWFNPGELILLPLRSIQLMRKEGFSIRACPVHPVHGPTARDKAS